ncbi:hypothetical protein [Leptospira fainei]|uniref:hypothetical protein n=1 Tax=Leptospira fainei TaxID=48782 RepID=UPI001E38B1C3|nr:hypothetical protein [Leptospira fainei]
MLDKQSFLIRIEGMEKRLNGLRIVSASLALFTLLFFLHLSHFSSYPGKKYPVPTQSITGVETEYQDDRNFVESLENSELSFDAISLEKIHNPAHLDSKSSRQDRFQFHFCKLLSQYLLNIPPPAFV